MTVKLTSAVADGWWRLSPSNSVTANPMSGMSLSGPSGDVRTPSSAVIELTNNRQLLALLCQSNIRQQKAHLNSLTVDPIGINQY